MHSNQARPPISRGIRGSVPPLTVTPPALILYGIPPDVAAECERVATELRLARAEVKHLQAACIALKAHPRAILLAAATIRPWDRTVLEEHAARAGVPLRWVGLDNHPDDVANDVRTWAADVLRRERARR